VEAQRFGPPDGLNSGEINTCRQTPTWNGIERYFPAPKFPVDLDGFNWKIALHLSLKTKVCDHPQVARKHIRCSGQFQEMRNETVGWLLGLVFRSLDTGQLKVNAFQGGSPPGRL